MKTNLVDLWAVRYHDWCLQRALEEFENGFPLLSLVLGRTAFELMEYARSLDDHKKRELAAALVKRFNPRYEQITGNTISAHEAYLIEGFLNYDKVMGPAGVLGMRPYASEREKAFVDAIQSGDTRKGDRRRIRKAIVQRLRGSLDEPESKPSGAIKYTTTMPGWKLRTVIDFGGSYGQVTYAHVLLPDSLPPLQPSIHICGWMGLAGQTTWDLYTVDEEPLVVDGIVTLVNWFLPQAAELVREFAV